MSNYILPSCNGNIDPLRTQTHFAIIKTFSFVFSAIETSAFRKVRKVESIQISMWASAGMKVTRGRCMIMAVWDLLLSAHVSSSVDAIPRARQFVLCVCVCSRGYACAVNVPRLEISNNEDHTSLKPKVFGGDREQTVRYHGAWALCVWRHWNLRYAVGVDGNVGADPEFRGLLSYRKLSIKIDQSPQGYSTFANI